MNAVDHLSPEAELARMREFIADRRLDREFVEFVETYARKRADASEPCVDFVYNLEGRRSSDQNMANITPWLREATTEDVLRLVSFGDCDAVKDEADNSFMFGIVEGCVDEEYQQKMYRYSGVSYMYNYQFHDNLRQHLKTIRPLDHAVILAAIDEVSAREDAEV